MNIRSLICVLTLVLSLSCASAALAQEKPSAWDEPAILATTQAWANMMGKADVGALQKLLDDRYMHIHGTARVENKTQFLEAFSSGARRYEPLTLEDVSVRIFGKAAIVSGAFALKAHVGGKVLEGVNRFSLIMVSTPEGNRIVSFQATAVPKP